MLQAIKDNKVYTINEAAKDSYLKQGFDIYNEDGEVEAYSPLKTIKYSEYVKKEQEIEVLKKQIEKLTSKQDETKSKK